MSDRDPRTPGGGSAGSGAPVGGDPVQLSRTDEIMYVQERYQQEPKPAAGAPVPAASAPASIAAPLAVARLDAAPTPPLAALPPSRALAAARLLTAALAVLLAAAFFYPAIHDALDRNARLIPLARDGAALAAPAPSSSPMKPLVAATNAYLSIDSAPRGATVRVDGVERGTTPTIASVACVPGSQLTIEVTATGHAPWRTQATCERDLVFAIAPSLQRAPRR